MTAFVDGRCMLRVAARIPCDFWNRLFLLHHTLYTSLIRECFLESYDLISEFCFYVHRNRWFPPGCHLSHWRLCAEFSGCRETTMFLGLVPDFPLFALFDVVGTQVFKSPS